jgi:DNA-binding transcriptional regulator/RsmH inhibitor MraZ
VSKGSARRPAAVPREDFDRNYEQALGSETARREAAALERTLVATATTVEAD